jgi:hypothetical protein
VPRDVSITEKLAKLAMVKLGQLTGLTEGQQLLGIEGKGKFFK